MLLRSSSAPLFRSRLLNSAIGSLLKSDGLIFPLRHFTRARSVSLTTSFEDPKPEEKCWRTPGALNRANSNLGSVLVSSHGLGATSAAVIVEEQLFVAEKMSPQTAVVDDGGWSKGGAISGGGRGSGDGSGSDSQDPGSWHGSERTDAYYHTMIEANPGNPLLLANYAKFLKEIKGDYSKAEVYCERAILADPTDSNVLSLYADLIWQTQKDCARAESYFDQAIKTDPTDCYVLASYARFLWDVDEDEEEEVHDDEVKTSQFELGTMNSYAKSLQNASSSNVAPAFTI